MKKKLRILRIWLHGKYWLAQYTHRRIVIEKIDAILRNINFVSPEYIDPITFENYANQSFLAMYNDLNKPSQP